MLSGLAMVLALAVAGQAPDASTIEEARKYFDAGRQAYASEKYLDAARAFRRANELAPNAAIVFSLAQSYRRQYFTTRDARFLHLALEQYRAYLAQVTTGGRRDDALDHVANLESIAARLPPMEVDLELDRPIKDLTQIMVTSQTSGAVVSFDGAEPEPVPLTKEVSPGEHLLVISAPGHFEERRKTTAVEGRFIVVEADLVEQSAKVTVSAPVGAAVSLDGRFIGTTPFSSPLEVKAGERVLTVTMDGRRPYSTMLTLERGDSTSIIAELETTTQRTVSYYFLGAGGVILAGTGVVVTIALAKEASARILIRKRDKDGQNLTVAERDEYISLRETRNDLLSASTAGMVGGVILAGVGAFLYFIDLPQLASLTPMLAPKPDGPAPSGHLVLPFGEGGVGLGWRQMF